MKIIIFMKRSINYSKKNMINFMKCVITFIILLILMKKIIVKKILKNILKIQKALMKKQIK